MGLYIQYIYKLRDEGARVRGVGELSPLLPTVDPPVFVLLYINYKKG